MHGILKKKIIFNKYIKNIITLMFGTVSGQLILIIATPLLTRIYSPSEFGVYGNFVAFAVIFSVVASYRYELAIVIPKDDNESLQIMWLSIYILIINTMLISLVFYIIGPILTDYLSWYDKQFAFFIPSFVLVMGLFQILNYWLTRKQLFKSLAYAQTLRSLSTVVSQVILGCFFIGFLKGVGLSFGHVLGQLIAVLFLIVVLVKMKNNITKIKISELIRIATKYKDYPIYSSGTSLINTTSNQLPTLLLTIYFSTSISGFYLLANRILSMPIGILGNAVAQVFLQKIAKEKSNNTTSKSAYKLWKYLMPFSLSINLCIFLFAPLIFEFAFGVEWRIAGEYARILSVWTVFKFIGTPLSSISYTYNKQKQFFLSQIVVFLARLLALIFGGIYGSPILSLILFSIIGALFNLKMIGLYVEIESGKKEAKIVRISNAAILSFMLLLLYLLI